MSWRLNILTEVESNNRDMYSVNILFCGGKMTSQVSQNIKKERLILKQWFIPLFLMFLKENLKVIRAVVILLREMWLVGLGLINMYLQLSQLMRLWYLSHRWPAKAQASLSIRAVSPEPSLFAHMTYGSRLKVQPKIRHLASLDGCACVFEECVHRGRKVP